MWATDIDSEPALAHLSDTRLLEMDMPYSANFKKDGRDWKTAVRSREQLLEWFSERDVCELLEIGFRVYELEVTEVCIEDNQVLFPVDAIIARVDISHEFVSMERMDLRIPEFISVGVSLFAPENDD